jgi:dCMP deaminase
MDVAQRTAELSRAVRLKVGAIIVKDDRIISLGFNGTPAGWDNCCEVAELAPPGAEDLENYPLEGNFYSQSVDHIVATRYRLKTRPEVLHAEMNALMKLARSHESGQGASMFVTHAPCMDCAKGIYQAGIQELYYSEEYRSRDGINFLNQCNMPLHFIPSKES